MKIEVLKLN